MVEPVAEDWKPEVRSRWLVLRTKDAGACTRLTSKKPAMLAHPTDCSCDAGPSGWCAVDGESIVSEVPPQLSRFAR